MTLEEAIEILKKVQMCSDMSCGSELSCEGEVELSCEGCSHEYTTEDFYKAIAILNASIQKAAETLDINLTHYHNEVNLCDSCKQTYPECPSTIEDVLFGDGKGDDNICACNKYEPSAQLEEAIPISWFEERIEKCRMVGERTFSSVAVIMHVMLNEWRREQHDT